MGPFTSVWAAELPRHDVDDGPGSSETLERSSRPEMLAEPSEVPTATRSRPRSGRTAATGGWLPVPQGRLWEAQAPLGCREIPFSPDEMGEGLRVVSARRLARDLTLMAGLAGIIGPTAEVVHFGPMRPGTLTWRRGSRFGTSRVSKATCHRA
jgi:hypothetical protein